MIRPHRASDPPQVNQPPARPPLASVAVISAAALAYEVLLMRLLSIVHWHHFAYMIISVALLGYGVSGTFLALARNRLRGKFKAAYITNATLFGLAALGGFLLAQSLPFNALEVLWDPVQPLWLAAIYLLFLVPFFCAANCICLALAEFGTRVHTTYSVDLLGAGAGAVGVIALLYVAEPITALKVVCACGLLSAFLASVELRAGPAWLKASLLAMAVGLFFPIITPRLEMSQFKGLAQTLEVTGAKVIDQRSSPLGLLTTVRSDEVPVRHAPGLSLSAPSGPPDQLAVFTDGEGMQAISRHEDDPAALDYLDYLTGALPYHLLEEPRVLVLGAGTGGGVRQALHLGARGVDAVELNPQVVALVEDTFGDYAGRPYSNPQVRLHMGDARGFVSGTEQRYDLVQLALLDAHGAASAGLQALGENYLYTLEGFRALLGTLRPGGMVSVTRWVQLPPRDGLKTLATARAALAASGVERPGDYIAMIRGWNTTTLLIGESPFSDSALDRLRAFCEARSFDLAYYPGMPDKEANRYNQLPEPWFYRGAIRILGADREAFFDEYKFDIRPATDDRPYFSRFLKWATIPEILRLKGQGGLPLLEQGYLVLVLTLVQATVISVALVLLPLWRRKPLAQARTGVATSRGRSLIYFFLVGTAFMLIEIAFIQKFVLFLHHPIFAVATVLGAFLVFAGLGSALSARWPATRNVSRPVAGIVALALAYLPGLPWLFDHLLHIGQGGRVLIAVALTAPPALLMGMPFPLGLRRLASGDADLIPWAWGMNGCASVISAIAATVLAIHLGFTVVVMVAVVAYTFAALMFPSPAPSVSGR